MSDVEDCNLAQPAPPGGDEKEVAERRRRPSSPPSHKKKKKNKKRRRDLADDEASEDDGEGDEDESEGDGDGSKKKKQKKKKKKKQKKSHERAPYQNSSDNEDGGFDLDAAAASFSNDDLKEEMLQHALNSGLAMGASASSEERCALASRKWDWESKVTPEDFCFLCQFGELTSQSSNHSDSCAELVTIFESNFGKASDKAVCILVKSCYDDPVSGCRKDVPDKADWPLESIMQHFIIDAPTDSIMATQSKRVAHLVTLACYREMGIRSKKTNKVRLNTDIAKLYLAVNKISQSTGKPASGWGK